MSRWGVPARKPAGNRRPMDPRYGSRRWKKLRLGVLARDLYRCQVVPGCPVNATVADHIRSVYEGMPDSEFFDPTNLRAACRAHNISKGHAETLQPKDRPSNGQTIFDAKPRPRPRIY